MKITDLKTTYVAYPPPHIPYKGGSYTVGARETIVATVFTDEGITGEVCIGNDVDNVPVLKYVKAFKKFIIGEDPFNIEKLWRKMFAYTRVGAPACRYAMRAIAIVDTALWDTVGKALNKPLYKVLGAYRDRMPVIALGGYYVDGKGLQEIKEEVQSYQSRGMVGVKFKVGRLSPEKDAERVRAAREAVGDNFIIICDSNNSRTPTDAIKFAKLVEEYDIRWLEEPVPWYDHQAMKMVKDAIEIPVAAGQSEIGRAGCVDLITRGCVDICNVTFNRGGGITEWRKIAAVADMYNVEMANVCQPRTTVHTMCSIPNATYIEIYGDAPRDPIWYQVAVNKPHIMDGFIYPPDKAGLGHEHNWELVIKFSKKGY